MKRQEEILIFTLVTVFLMYPSAIADVKVGSVDGKTHAFGSVSNVTTYTVAFTELGLPSGTWWLVDLNGTVKLSTSNVIKFVELNGNYVYFAGQEFWGPGTPSYVATLASGSGSVTVNEADVNKEVTFISAIPEFPSLTFLPLFMMAALLAVIIYRKGRISMSPYSNFTHYYMAHNREGLT
jgi:hypothetical protein